jgi:hypothetical protein
MKRHEILLRCPECGRFPAMVMIPVPFTDGLYLYDVVCDDSPNQCQIHRDQPLPWCWEEAEIDWNLKVLLMAELGDQ